MALFMSKEVLEACSCCCLRNAVFKNKRAVCLSSQSYLLLLLRATCLLPRLLLPHCRHIPRRLVGLHRFPRLPLQIGLRHLQQHHNQRHQSFAQRQ